MNKMRLKKRVMAEKNKHEWFYCRRVALTIHFPVDLLTPKEISNLTFRGYWIKNSWNYLQNKRVYIVRYEKPRYAKNLINETLKICKPYLSNKTFKIQAGVIKQQTDTGEFIDLFTHNFLNKCQLD